MKVVRCAATTAAALGLSTTATLAGGFEVREQSTYFQGMSFAGAAAGGSSLSSMFWNPAAAAFVGPGVTTNSNFALIIPESDVTVNTVGRLPCGVGVLAGDCSVDIGRDAIVPASYLAWRFDSKTVFALSVNSQFGLGTKPDNPNWIGGDLARSAKLFSINIAPTVAYEIMPGVAIGGGVQFQYLDLKRLKSDSVPGPGVGPSAVLEGSDLGVGFTFGVNVNPAPGTSIGVGYRSWIDHELEGSLAGVLPISADVETPDKVTVSLRQDLSQNLRLHATAEWVNWGRLDVIPIKGTFIPAIGGIVLDFQWEDGWFFALGGEYDYSDKLTLRAGGAYEISPIDDPTQRLVQVPDSDRVWASIGATYKLSEAMSFDVAYTHIWIDDSTFARTPAPVLNPTLFVGDVDSSVDIVSVGMTMKLPPLE